MFFLEYHWFGSPGKEIHVFGAKIGLGYVLLMAQGMFVQGYGYGDEADIRILRHMAGWMYLLGHGDGFCVSLRSTNNDIDAVCSGIVRAF